MRLQRCEPQQSYEEKPNSLIYISNWAVAIPYALLKRGAKLNTLVKKSAYEFVTYIMQFVIFKPLSYCFKEIIIGFVVKASFASRPLSRLIRWYNKRILRKGYSIPQDFSWIENYKLYGWYFFFVTLLFCQFTVSHTNTSIFNI